jgi:hypothetical protein
MLPPPSRLCVIQTLGHALIRKLLDAKGQEVSRERT